MIRPTAFVLLLCTLLNGCFTYAPTQSVPDRATRVRVLLSSPTDFRLTDFTANEVVVAEGELIRADGEELVLSALDLQARSGYEFAGKGETLTIPRSNVASIQTKRISVARSVLLAGALVVVMTAMERLIGVGGGGDDGGGGGPPIET